MIDHLCNFRDKRALRKTRCSKGIVGLLQLIPNGFKWSRLVYGRAGGERCVVTGSAPIGIICPFNLSEVRAEFTSDCQIRITQGKSGTDTWVLRSLAFTSIPRGARAGLYPLLNLNSMESPIGPNSERGYFAPLEELIDGRRMNLQKLGYFFYR